MRKLWLLGGLLLLLGSAAAQQSVIVPATEASINVAGTVATITKIISGITGQRIYLTAIALHPAPTSAVTLSQGTGTNCGTNNSVIYGPATFQSGENWTQGSGNGAIFALNSGTDLCITVSSAVSPGFISYAQF